MRKAVGYGSKRRKTGPLHFPQVLSLELLSSFFLFSLCLFFLFQYLSSSNPSLIFLIFFGFSRLTSWCLLLSEVNVHSGFCANPIRLINNNLNV